MKVFTAAFTIALALFLLGTAHAEVPCEQMIVTPHAEEMALRQIGMSELFKRERARLSANVVALRTAYRAFRNECVVSVRFHENLPHHAPFWREFAVNANGTVLCADVDDNLGPSCRSPPE